MSYRVSVTFTQTVSHYEHKVVSCSLSNTNIKVIYYWYLEGGNIYIINVDI